MTDETGPPRRGHPAGPLEHEGRLVVVARAQDQTEGEFVQNLLRAEGIPSLLRRAPGFDVPDFLAAGPRDVLVPAPAEQDARDVLYPAEPQDADG